MCTLVFMMKIRWNDGRKRVRPVSRWGWSKQYIQTDKCSTQNCSCLLANFFVDLTIKSLHPSVVNKCDTFQMRSTIIWPHLPRRNIMFTPQIVFDDIGIQNHLALFPCVNVRALCAAKKKIRQICNKCVSKCTPIQSNHSIYGWPFAHHKWTFSHFVATVDGNASLNDLTMMY